MMVGLTTSRRFVGLLGLAVVIGAGLSLTACGNNSPAVPDAGANCVGDPRGETFVVGITKSGKDNRLTFALMEATPAPPSRGDNTWLVDISQAGAPVVGAVVTVKPFMPDHRHGSAIDTLVTPDPVVPGRYQLAPVNLWMPGIWEVTIAATPVGGTKDLAVFSFCIAG
jgi:hypothetical protein